MKTISDMKAAIAGLQASFAKLFSDKATAATAEQLAGFQTQLGSLETTVTSELTQARSDLATAQASLKSLGDEKAGVETTNKSLTTDLSALLGGISAACTELSLELKAEATGLESLTALKNGVSSTLARAGFPVAKLPAAPAPKSDGKTVMTRTEFAGLTPAAKMSFVKAGGKLTD